MDSLLALAMLLLALLGVDAPRGGWPAPSTLRAHLHEAGAGVAANLSRWPCRVALPLPVDRPLRCVRATSSATTQGDARAQPIDAAAGR